MLPAPLTFETLGPIYMTQQSIYETSYADRPAYGPLESSISSDIAIIGGGLTGISAALRLAEAGFDVTVLESARIGNGGSGRNGGHVCQGWPNDFHHISRQLGKDEADIAWDAGMKAVDLVSERVAKYNIDCDLRFGYLHAALHQRQMDELVEMQDEWEARGYDKFTRLDSPSALAPYIGTDAYVGALYDTGCGHMQPLRYLHGLAKAAIDAGARIFEQTHVTNIEGGRQKIIHTQPINQNTATNRGRSGPNVGPTLTARIILLCGNAYIGDIALPQMKSRLAQVTSSVLASAPLSPNVIGQILPTQSAVADCNAALNYYRIDADGRMIFGGRASYTNVELGNVERDLRRRMQAVFPLLADIETEQVWSGRIGITVNRIPHFGRSDNDIYFVQGFSGHGVALSGQAGVMLADAVIGDATRFDVMQSLNHLPFPGGPLRTPALALGMAYYKLRDQLKL